MTTLIIEQKRAAGCAGRGDTAAGRERAGNQKHPVFLMLIEAGA